MHFAYMVTCLALTFAFPIGGEPKAEFEVYARPYFVKNNAPLPTNPAYLIVNDKKAFDEIFGVAFVMGQKPKLVGETLFEKNRILVVVKSGNFLATYKVEDVRIDKRQLQLKYTATDKGPTSARFNSPLIVAVPRGDYDEVAFIENGKEAARQKLKK
ncbi:MAG: hypothetical protein FJ303_11060 [Planctomycetes bacterium]|nr:hypothetical protein [Planctomycetota bacterium]